MTTIIDVSTEAELDAAIAEANASASGSSFEIVLQADISENYVLVNAVDLPSGVTLSISDDAFTLAGPYALAPAVTITSGSTLTAVGAVPSGEMITFAGTPVRPMPCSMSRRRRCSRARSKVLRQETTRDPVDDNRSNSGTYNSTDNPHGGLSLTDGGTTVATLSLEGDYSAATFQVSADNVTVTLPSVAATLSSGTVVSGTEEVAAARQPRKLVRLRSAAAAIPQPSLIRELTPSPAHGA